MRLACFSEEKAARTSPISDWTRGGPNRLGHRLSGQYCMMRIVTGVLGNECVAINVELHLRPARISSTILGPVPRTVTGRLEPSGLPWGLDSLAVLTALVTSSAKSRGAASLAATSWTRSNRSLIVTASSVMRSRERGNFQGSSSPRSAGSLGTLASIPKNASLEPLRAHSSSSVSVSSADSF